MNYQERFPVEAGDFASAGEVSATIKQKLKKIGVAQALVRRVAIVSYEAELNMIIHSLGGEMVLELSPREIRIIYDDVGPGIPDISLAMQEGYSTAPESIRMMGFGAGMGLPNMKKYTDEMKVESQVGVGTTVTMRVYVQS